MEQQVYSGAEESNQRKLCVILYRGWRCLRANCDASFSEEKVKPCSDPE